MVFAGVVCLQPTPTVQGYIDFWDSIFTAALLLVWRVWKYQYFELRAKPQQCKIWNLIMSSDRHDFCTLVRETLPHTLGQATQIVKDDPPDPDLRP